jgi:peroxiredoxin
MAMNSAMVPLGTTAPDFTLPRADGSGDVSLADFADSPALLVVFLCVHCPYVKNLEEDFAAFAREYEARGLAIVGISCNDVDAYPDDAPENMVEQARRVGFPFPYLYDESQEVAQAFKAACTPDFFLYDKDRKLAYRGQFDDSRPSNGLEPTGDDLRMAVDLVLIGKRVPEPHAPSVGCSLKWKPGNEPLPFRVGK